MRNRTLQAMLHKRMLHAILIAVLMMVGTTASLINADADGDTDGSFETVSIDDTPVLIDGSRPPRPASKEEQCMSFVTSMFSCVDFVLAPTFSDGRRARPSRDCCDGIKAIADTVSTACLCRILSDNDSSFSPTLTYPAPALNYSLVLQLPSLCRLPRAYSCTARGPSNRASTPPPSLAPPINNPIPPIKAPTPTSIVATPPTISTFNKSSHTRAPSPSPYIEHHLTPSPSPATSSSTRLISISYCMMFAFTFSVFSYFLSK